MMRRNALDLGILTEPHLRGLGAEQSMAADQPSGARQSATFSLRTTLLIVTCVGVGSVAFRINRNGSIAGRYRHCDGSRQRFPDVVVSRDAAIQANAVHALACVSLFPRNTNPVSLLLPARHADFGLRGTARNAPTIWKQLGLALLAYERAYGSFPPAYVADANGKPLYSWRVLIFFRSWIKTTSPSKSAAMSRGTARTTRNGQQRHSSFSIVQSTVIAPNHRPH